MTSEAKRAANRANAQKSTGPRSSEGKARASQNATRHGLATSVADDPAAQERIAALTAALAGEGASPAAHAQAALVAEAQVELYRARAARTQLQGQLITALGGSGGLPLPPLEPIWLASPTLITPGEMKKIALGKMGFDSLFTMSRLMAQSRALYRHSEREAGAEEKQIRDRLDTLLRDLARIDRYERRALSRRRTAVRHLDELRAAARPDT